MTVAEVKTAIRNKCRELGAPEAVLLAMAQVESNFNATAGYPGGSYWGVLQLASGYGTCADNERLDVGKSVACVWKHMQADRKNFANNNIPWEDWYYYGVHQQGLAGFKQILQYKNSKLSELAKVSATRVSNIRGNMLGTKAERDRLVYVSEWINYWRNRINGLIAEYAAEDSGGGTGNGGGDDTDKKDDQHPEQHIIIGPIEVFGKKIEVERNDLLIGAGIVVVAGLAWCYYRGKRGGLSDGEDREKIEALKEKAKTANSVAKRRKLIAEFYGIVRSGGEVKVFNKDLQKDIYVNRSSAGETVAHAAKSKKSTEASFELLSVLKNAKKVKEEPIKSNTKKQQKFSKMLVLTDNIEGIGEVKLTVGVTKTECKHIQYCLTSLK